MDLAVEWSTPKKIKEGNSHVYVREWLIPKPIRGDFFEYWKTNKLNLLLKGYSIDKKKTEWFLKETKEKKSDFDKKIKPTEKTKPLKKYKLKNKDGLRPWQVNSVEKLVSSIKQWGCAVDGSEVGVGKTYQACATARELGMNIMVVCPKAVKESWRRVIYNHFKLGDTCIGIVNYEQLRMGKKDSLYASYIRNRKTHKKVFTWKIPKRTLIIWDEAQKLKNHKTKNSETCIAALDAGYKMLFCSATIATNPLELRTVGKCLQLFKNDRQYYTWAYEHGVVKGYFGLEFTNDKEALCKLHEDIFVNRGVRLNRDTIPNFPDSQIIAECYEMEKEDSTKIDQIYQDMQLELLKLEKLTKKEKNKHRLTAILRARQSVELLKVPLFVDMINEGLENNMSVVVFCNFTDTISAISERIDTKCIINGEVKDVDRQQNIDNFQADKERVILVNINAGGAGLSLHDLNGNYPRLALISPSYSAVMMRQATGRVWRDSAKTKSIQKIVFVANTIEETVCNTVNNKLNNLDLLNDGDLEYEER